MFAARQLLSRTGGALRPSAVVVAGSRNRAAVQPPTQMVKRGMAGGHAPPATGWEGEVRKVLKEDWQVVCGIMGFYTTLYLISKLFTGGGKKEAPAAAVAAPAASSADSGVVSMADDKFSEWLASSPANEKAWEQSLDDPKSYE